MKEKLKILFMGTPEFAVPCLQALFDEGYELVGAVTQPDKPKGRGHKTVPTPVKECALKYGVDVYQPESLKNGELMPVLEEKQPDIIIVVAYGKILPEYVLDFPRFGCVNVHASLLPKYRGAAPIQHAVINGEKSTGVTTMYMERGLDTGDMIFKSETEIGEEETYGELHDRLSVMGAELLLKTVAAITDGSAAREKQDDALSCYASMMSKETGRIDWSKPQKQILNLIRGTNPWPMSCTEYSGEMMKVIKASAGIIDTVKPPGEIVSADKSGITVACGDGKTVLITEMQIKGGKRMAVSDYLNGHSINIGTVLI